MCTGGWVGLVPAEAWNACVGAAAGHGLAAAPRWYFADQWLAVPRGSAGPSRSDAAVDPFTEVRALAWNDRRADPHPALPPLVWIQAPHLLSDAQFVHPTAAGAQPAVIARGERLALDFTARATLNRSWIDASTFDWLSGGPLRLRGIRTERGFTAHTLWPQAWRIGGGLPAGGRPEPTWAAVRTAIRSTPLPASGSEFRSRCLWRRERARPVQTPVPGTPVLAAILSGAQGDDDESLGGHFAIVTGRTAAGGAIADWIVNNFYALDSVSEKAILAAPTPLDNYLAALNSGQSWYRPSWMIVAELDDDEPARRVQEAFSRLFVHFYRHRLWYEQATMNCTGITVDALRALGMPLPRTGATSWCLAPLAIPWAAIRERALDKGRIAFDYLTEDRTRLLPAVAFEHFAARLIGLAVGQPGSTIEPLEARIARALSALHWLELPQIPSSRAWGSAPVASLAEHQARVPADPARRQIVPVPARPYPPDLRGGDWVPRPLTRGDKALRALLLAPLAIAAAALGGWYGSR